MDHQPHRRKARAIAISSTAESRRTALVARAMTMFGLVFGAVDAFWVVHHIIAAR